MTRSTPAKHGTVILTYGRSLMSLVAAQSLSRRGLEVIGCDSVDLTVLRFSRFVDRYFTHPDPRDDEDRYIQRLCEMIEKHRPRDNRPYVLMPMFDDARLLARRASELPSSITLAAPAHQSIDKIYPKDRLAETMKAFPDLAPVSLVINDGEDLTTAAEETGFPAVIKPADGVGGRGVEFVEDANDLAQAFARGEDDFAGPHILQEAVDGEDYCMTALASNGEIVAAMAYKNLEVFPKKSGAGTIRETVDHQPFLAATRAVLQESGWHGVAEIDFRWNGDTATTPQIIEVNARFWAGLYHSMASGIDYPWLLYQMSVFGGVSETPAPEIGKRTKTPVLSRFSAMSAVASRAFRFAAAKRAISTGFNKINQGSLRDGMQNIWRGVAGAVAFNRGAFAAHEEADYLKNSQSEFNNAHDPYAGLGVLFILSSLLRYGKLPDEVKF